MTGQGNGLRPSETQGHDNSSSSTMVPTAGNSAVSVLNTTHSNDPPQDIILAESGGMNHFPATYEKDFHNVADGYATTHPKTKQPFKKKLKRWFAPDGNLRPFRLLKQDIKNIRIRYVSDWTTFNQLIFASAVYVFFTNLLPGITFASDLYVLTGKTWGTIEVVFSTGLCGLIFSL